MSNLYRLVGFALLGLLLASCSAQKRVWYLQDVQPASPEQIVQNGEIRIKPLDRLIVVVNSKDPELAVPFNSSTAMSSLSGSTTSTNSIESLQTRTVDEQGCIVMPILGTIHCEGLTRNELARLIADKIVEGGYINDPSVNVQFSDMKFSVIGEVAHPGSFEIDRDRISILDALAMAGDMTVYGMRNEVIVAREADGKRTIEVLDLTSKDVFSSPAFYLQQNDVVYVKPNKYKAQSAEISQNRSFYLSLVSTAISVITLTVSIISLAK